MKSTQRMKIKLMKGFVKENIKNDFFVQTNMKKQNMKILGYNMNKQRRSCLISTYIFTWGDFR